jgi:hypothetical protein
VLLVTKAVGDFLSVRGIADEMIRFNGYPFLEKEDHAFHVPVSRVMRRKVQTLPATGLRMRDLGLSSFSSSFRSTLSQQPIGAWFCFRRDFGEGGR